MKVLLIPIFLFLFSQVLYAQDKVVEVNLNKDESIQEMVSLGPNGFVLRIGEPPFASKYKFKKESQIQYYDASCNLIWVKPIKENYSYLENQTSLIASESGSYIYFIESKGHIYDSKTQYITQIKKDGTEKIFEIKGKEEFGKKLQAVFCDDDYLYYLTTEDGNESHDKKKAKEKLILNRFSSSNLSHSRSTIDVPPITSGKTTTYWSYIGQKGSDNYLLSKSIEKESGKSSFTIISFNQQGEIERNIPIEVNLEDKFLRPGYHVNSHRTGYENVSDMDFTSKTVGSSTPGAQSGGSGASGQTTYSNREIPTNGAFSQLTFDPENNVFYVFGLFGPKSFNNIGSVYEGFYIYKFDIEGKNIWKLKQLVSKELMDEGVFRVHGVPSDRNISMKILPDETLNFSIHFRKTIFSHEISSTGKLLKERIKEKHYNNTDNTILLTSKKLKSDHFIEVNYAKLNKDINFLNVLSQEGEYLMELDSKGSKLKILYFKNTF